MFIDGNVYILWVLAGINMWIVLSFMILLILWSLAHSLMHLSILYEIWSVIIVIICILNCEIYRMYIFTRQNPVLIIEHLVLSYFSVLKITLYTLYICIIQPNINLHFFQLTLFFIFLQVNCYWSWIYDYILAVAKYDLYCAVIYNRFFLTLVTLFDR